MRSPIKLFVVLAGLIAFSPSNAQIDANVALVSDYLFRGISQTDEQPALQGGLDWNHPSGFYLGSWLSNTDFNPPGDESSGVEVDLYGGYSWALGESAISLGVISYQYPGIDTHLDEVVLGYSYRGFQAQFFHDWDNDTDYLSAGYDWSLARDISLSVAGGRFDSDPGFGYTHYQLALAKPFRGFDWSVTVSDTDIEQDDVTVLLGISTEFSF